MSSTASDIVTAIMSTAATAVGAGYQELAHVYDPGKNNIRQARKAYGARVGGGEPAQTVMTAYTMDQVFELVFTDTVPKVADHDEQLRDAIGTMLDKADEFFKRAVQTKLGVAAVLLVSEPRLSPPEIIDGETKMVVLVLQITVKYRNTLV